MVAVVRAQLNQPDPLSSVLADAGSKRECKNKAARKILDLLLESRLSATDTDEPMNVTKSNDDEQESQIDLEIQGMSIDDVSEEEFDLQEPMGLQMFAYNFKTDPTKSVRSVG